VAPAPAPPPPPPPPPPASPLQAGDQARAVGDLAAATAHYRAAVEKAANDLGARRRLAQVLAETGRLREAIAQLEIVLWQTPKDAVLRGLVGALRGRLAKEGEGPAVTMARVREAVAARKLTFARADADGLVAARPKDPEALALRGEVLLASGEARAALADFQRALELGPPRPHVHFGHAEALRAAGDHAKARTAYEHFLRTGGGEAWRVAAARRALAEMK
jgi:tetratricopeptide (TPR) repeat protein